MKIVITWTQWFNEHHNRSGVTIVDKSQLDATMVKMIASEQIIQSLTAY